MLCRGGEKHRENKMQNISKNLGLVLQNVNLWGIIKKTAHQSGGRGPQIVKVWIGSVLPLSIERTIAFRVNTGAIRSSME